MTVLNRLYASAGPEIIHRTLEITDGVVTHYLTNGWGAPGDDGPGGLIATLENGQTVTFIACGMDVALPARNADGTQDLKFALCNITGEISAYIRTVLKEKRRCQLAYREFISTDLSAPAEPPHWFKVKAGQWTSTQVDITAGYFNLLETAWPRRQYTLTQYPGLRYIT